MAPVGSGSAPPFLASEAPSEPFLPDFASPSSPSSSASSSAEVSSASSTSSASTSSSSISSSLSTDFDEAVFEAFFAERLPDF